MTRGVNGYAYFHLKIRELSSMSTKVTSPFKFSNLFEFMAMIPDDKAAETVTEFVHANVRKGAIHMSDEYSVYRGISTNYDHRVIVHRIGEYVTPDGTPTNGIENYWSHLKRSILGVNHYISPEHLNLYVDSQSFR